MDGGGSALIHVLPFRQHRDVENSGYEDAVGLDSVKHNVHALFHPTQSGAYLIAGATQLRPIRQPLATGFQLVEIVDCLIDTPGLLGVLPDVHQVCLGEAGKAEYGHSSVLLCRELQLPPDALERIARGDTAGVAGVNRRLQRGKFQIVFTLLAFQSAKRRADDFTGVFVAAAVDFREHEAVQFRSEIDIPGWHYGNQYTNLAKFANGPGRHTTLAYGPCYPAGALNGAKHRTDVRRGSSKRYRHYNSRRIASPNGRLRVALTGKVAGHFGSRLPGNARNVFRSSLDQRFLSGGRLRKSCRQESENSPTHDTHKRAGR